MKRIYLLRVFTSESMIPRPCFQTLKHRSQLDMLHVCLLSSLFQFYFSLFQAIKVFYVVVAEDLQDTSTCSSLSKALFWHRCLISIPLVFHYLFAKLVHLY